MRSIRLLDDVVANGDVLLSKVQCEVDLEDNGGQIEKVVATIGTLELLECAAWLLEQSMMKALGHDDPIPLPQFFPYRIAQAAIEHAAPGTGDDEVLAIVLAALQSSDAPEGFYQLLTSYRHGQLADTQAIRTQALSAISQNDSKLAEMLNGLEKEFSNDGVMAEALRHVVKTSRLGFDKRKRDPFFELSALQAGPSKQKTFENLLSDLLPCAVLQVNPGSEDTIARDFVLNFASPPGNEKETVDNHLRILHCIFHWVNAHRDQSGFVEAANVRPHQCPYFTSCDLKLRQSNPETCRHRPWESADWTGWNEYDGNCWYGTAVKVTRPP